jgi:hypothetical protein
MSEAALLGYQVDRHEHGAPLSIDPAARETLSAKWHRVLCDRGVDWIRKRSRRRAGAALKSFERIYREIYSSGKEREEEVPESDLPDKTP